MNVRRRAFVRPSTGAAIALAAITALAAALRLVDLGRAGLGNLFYASAVRSMGESWHNLLFAAYDPAGTLTIDKPPLALWVQVAFTKALGFEGWVMILPMALASTIAVPLTFAAARRSHGLAVGLVAALLLAVLPESVATARDSTMDALMMAMLAGGAWLLITAVEGRRPRLLLAWAMLMGLVFNVKFFEGFFVLPAAAVYIAVRWRGEWRSRLPLLARVAAVLVAVSLAWVTLVELTPADRRPIVMNDVSNSAYGLVARYNGLERVLPGEVTIFAPLPGALPRSSALREVSALRFGVGDRGVARLFTGANGPLLGTAAMLALFGVAMVLWRRRDWLDGPGLLWVGWGVTGMVLFSASNRAPVHYTEAYAPALAILGAVGLVEAWRLRRGWLAAVLPLEAALLLAVGWIAMRNYPPLLDGAKPVAVLGVATAIAALLAVALRARLPLRAAPAVDALRLLPAAAALVSMLVVAGWIALEAPRGGAITRPNPVIYAHERPPDVPGRRVPAEAALRAMGVGGEGARYAFAIDGINRAGEAIAFTGASVLPLWNEYQRRPVLEAEALGALLAAGEVPYLLFDSLRSDRALLTGVFEVLARHCDLAEAEPVGRAYRLARCGVRFAEGGGG